MKLNTNKTYLFTVLIGAMLVFSGIPEAEARRGGGGSRSSSSRSSSSSWGRTSSKPSSSARSGSRSSSKSSWGRSKPSKTFTPDKASTKSSRAKTMAAKKRTQSQKTYKKTQATVAKTNSKDWNKGKSSFASKNNYKPRSDVKYGKKYSQSQRREYRDRYNNSYRGYYYNDPYDHSMIWGFSSLWWYHHWSTVDRNHYANDARMRQIEKEVAIMKAKKMALNPNYMDSGMTDTTAYSNGYMNGVKEGKLKQNNGPSALAVILTVFLTLGLLGLVIWWLASRTDDDY